MNMTRREFSKGLFFIAIGTTISACEPISQAVQGLQQIPIDARNAACGDTVAPSAMCFPQKSISSSPGQIVAPYLRQPVFIVNPDVLHLPQMAIEAAKQAGLIAEVSTMKNFVFTNSQNPVLKEFPDQIEIKGDKDKKVQFIVEVAETAAKSGSPTVLDIGASASTYPAGYKHLNSDSTVFAIEADSRQMFRSFNNEAATSNEFIFYFHLHTDDLRSKVLFDKVIVHNPVSEYKAITESYGLVKPGGQMIIVPYRSTEGDIPNQIYLAQERIPELKGKIRVIEVANTQLPKLTGKGVLYQFAQQHNIPLSGNFGESNYSDPPTPNGTSKIIIIKK